MNIFDELRDFLEDEGVLHTFIEEYKKSYNIEHRIDEENFAGSVRVHEVIDASLYWAASGGVDWSAIHKKWHNRTNESKQVTNIKDFTRIVDTWVNPMFIYLKGIKNDY